MNMCIYNIDGLAVVSRNLLAERIIMGHIIMHAHLIWEVVTDAKMAGSVQQNL